MLLASLPAPTPLELLAHYTAGTAELVRAGMVLSADGAASSGGLSAPLSGPADRAVFRALRALSDVVLVGAGTARQEDYRSPVLAAELVAWRRGHGLADLPRLAVVTRSGDLDPAARLFAGPPPLVVTTRRARAATERRLGDRAQVVATGAGEVDLPALLGVLREQGLAHVLCEGGPMLLGDLLRAGLVDELCCTLSPLLAGGAGGAVGGALPAPVPLRPLHCLEAGGALLLRYAVG